MTIQTPNHNLTERQSQILRIVEQSGFATIEALADKFAVSAQTVRRDIIALAVAGRVQRFHGGAGPMGHEEAARLDYSAKKQIARPEKRAVGRKAALLIPDGATLYLDVGTTVEACAAELSKRKGFTIFTNSMPAAMKFDPGEHQVHLLGGRMAGRDGSLVGHAVVASLQAISLDFSLIACSAIDDQGRVMDFDLEKIGIKKAAMKAADKSLLLATGSKFGRRALAEICDIDAFAEVVSEG